MTRQRYKCSGCLHSNIKHIRKEGGRESYGRCKVAFCKCEQIERGMVHTCSATVFKRRLALPRYLGTCGQPASIHVTDEHAQIRNGWYYKRHGRVAVMDQS